MKRKPSTIHTILETDDLIDKCQEIIDAHRKLRKEIAKVREGFKDLQNHAKAMISEKYDCHCKKECEQYLQMYANPRLPVLANSPSAKEPLHVNFSYDSDGAITSIKKIQCYAQKNDVNKDCEGMAKVRKTIEKELAEIKC